MEHVEGPAPPAAVFADTRFDALTLPDVLRWVELRPSGAEFAYVVTPNVDHIVRLNCLPVEHEAHLAYRNAALSLCDSQVLRALGRLGGLRLTIVRGSDLTERLLQAMRPGSRVLVIGGDARTLSSLRALTPTAVFTQHLPPMGLLSNPLAMQSTVAFVEENPAELIFLAVGSPQQELIAYRVHDRGKATGTAFCIGAAIEFATGEKPRAPEWMRAAALEWAYRLLTEPRRLWRRYLVDGLRIVPITLRWLTNDLKRRR